MADSGVTFEDLLRWRCALANCALEGNQYAQEQLKLWDEDRNAFIVEYIRQRGIWQTEL